VPPDIRVDPPCCSFKGGTAQDPTGEYVCFRSYDGRAINMTGWLVKDNVGLRYTFPTFVLPPGAVVTLHSGHGQNTATDLYRGGGLIWNNDGDTVYLRDASDNEVDTYTY
jgi:competence protein ComEC